jgi:hypothetical protein
MWQFAKIIGRGKFVVVSGLRVAMKGYKGNIVVVFKTQLS